MTFADPADCWSMTVQRSDSIDEGEVRRSLGLLVDASHHVQIQALPSGRWKHVAGKDTEGLVRAISEFSDEKGVYLSLNPYAGPLDRALRSADVLSRHWFLVDPDAVKPGDKDASTTDDEKDQSRAVTEAVRDHLRALGWPDPIFVDSGNNWQLLYQVDLPNDKMSQQILSKSLKALGDLFDTPGVKIDRAVHDAKRICKIPGTMVRKGDNTPDRPWRRACLVSVPVALTPVPVELIKSLAGLSNASAAPALSPTAAINPWSIPVGGDDRTAYARSALEREIGIVATAQQPGRNETLYNAALKLGTLVGAGLLNQTEVERLLEAAARACGLGEDGDTKEIDRAIKNGFGFGVQNPRQIPDRIATKQNIASAAYVTAANAEETSEPLFIKASTVTPKKVVWLWENRIPKGFITVFAGRTGLGKSFVTCDIVARLTSGEAWPDSQSGECNEPANVLMISEDPFEYVLTPRLIEMGANLERVHYLSWSAMAHYQLGDTTFLDAAFAQMAPLALVAIDPPTNFLGGKDEHKNAEVRSMLMNLVGWLNGRDTACILITHVNKASGKGGEALSRVIGSVAWTTTARVAHAFVADADRPDGAIFVPMKSNLGALPKGIAYRIAKTDDFAKVEWLGQVDTTADEAMGGEKPKEDKQTKVAQATEWLKDRFVERFCWSSEEVMDLGKVAGFNRNQMFEAKKALGAKASKSHEKDGGWNWILNYTEEISSTVQQFDSSAPF